MVVEAVADKKHEPIVDSSTQTFDIENESLQVTQSQATKTEIQNEQQFVESQLHSSSQQHNHFENSVEQQVSTTPAINEQVASFNEDIQQMSSMPENQTQETSVTTDIQQPTTQNIDVGETDVLTVPQV